MAAPTAEVIAFLDELLQSGSFDDYGPNGLQVPGARHISTVVTGVSAHGELFEQAAELGADLILVHHGLFWSGQPLHITTSMHRRLRLLFDNGMALAAYHLPLDAHMTHGNNALLAEGLGLTGIQRLAALGTQGVLPAPEPLDQFALRIQALLAGRAPLVIDGGAHPVHRVGIVSGAATDHIHAARAAGCDTFVTGEPAERAYGFARDDSIHFVAAGHHATETLGIRRLGDLLAERFGIAHTFVDVTNPI